MQADPMQEAVEDEVFIDAPSGSTPPEGTPVPEGTPAPDAEVGQQASEEADPD